MNIRVDPEFEAKIPSLSDDEFRQLEENILEAGEVYDPIVTWNGVIVDGHNRWRVIQQHPEIKYTVREMDFADKWAAFDWMYRNQLGRRNLPDAQRAYMWGKMQEARKQSRGTNRYTSDKRCHDDTSTKTAEVIAQEVGVSPSTIVRAERFAKGVDAIREESPEAADKILRGDINPSRQDVAAVARMEGPQRTLAVQSMMGNPPPVPRSSGAGVQWSDEEEDEEYTRERRTSNDPQPPRNFDDQTRKLSMASLGIGQRFTRLCERVKKHGTPADIEDMRKMINFGLIPFLKDSLEILDR